MSVSFKAYVKECMEGVPGAIWDPTTISHEVLNNELADITDEEVLHPELSYEQVCQYLESHGIDLPPASMYADDFVESDGEIILPLASPHSSDLLYLYFAFALVDGGHHYDILAEIVTENELESILTDDDITT